LTSLSQVDASVVLSAFFPDEDQAQAQDLIRAHVTGRERLVAPTLLRYEVTNAILQAMRRARIAVETGEAILRAIEDLNIELRPVAWRRVQWIGEYKSGGSSD
jgi:predicted nucleic acid-binding protein